MPAGQLIKWEVSAETPKGTVYVEVPTHLGEEAAKRRALFTLASAGYGDLDTIVIQGARELP